MFCLRPCQSADEDDDPADASDAGDAQVGHVVAVVVQEGPVARQPRQDEEHEVDREREKKPGVRAERDCLGVEVILINRLAT